MGQKKISNLLTEEGRFILADVVFRLYDIHLCMPDTPLHCDMYLCDNIQKITMFPKNEKFHFLFIVFFLGTNLRFKLLISFVSQTFQSFFSEFINFFFSLLYSILS